MLIDIRHSRIIDNGPDEMAVSKIRDTSLFYFISGL